MDETTELRAAGLPVSNRPVGIPFLMLDPSVIGKIEEMADRRGITAVQWIERALQDAAEKEGYDLAT